MIDSHTEDVLLLNAENDRLKSIIQQMQLHIHQVDCSYEEKIQLLLQEKEASYIRQLQDSKSEIHSKMKAMQQDWVHQIELRDQEIAQLQAQKMTVEEGISKGVCEQESKYDQRLALVKKIHDE